jgi:hypothetical protein
MARKRYKPEEIVAKLRQVDVLVSQGQNMMDAIRQIGVSEGARAPCALRRDGCSLRRRYGYRPAGVDCIQRHD